MTTRRRRSTTSSTARGLGVVHRRRRADLMRQHVDGTPCPCQPGCGPGCPCGPGGGLPMFRDPRLNYDGLPLEADHVIARSKGGTIATRLLLATCNRSRGAGRDDNNGGFGQLRTSREW